MGQEPEAGDESTPIAGEAQSTPTTDDGVETAAIDREDGSRSAIIERVVLGLMAGAALAWIVAVAIVGAGMVREGVGAAALLRGMALASAPLALLAALLVLWRRSGSREAGRYADAARVVRRETLALDAVLGLASRRLAEDREAVAAEADRLVALADETSARLREATGSLSREIAALAATGRGLDEAAGTARVDMGVLLADLPVAEAQVRALAEQVRDTGLAAHEQASGFQAALSGLAARAKEAEDANAGAANRLAAQVSRVASASDAAARGIGEAEGRMGAGIDGLLARAAQAVERTHAGIVAQGEAIDAMIARASAGADTAASRAADVIGGRVSALAAEIEALGALLTQSDGAGIATVERIRHALAAVETRFAALDETGRARTERLSEGLGQLWAHAEKTMAALNGGGTAATTLINRTETLHAGVRACLSDLDATLPQAFDMLDERIAATTPGVGRLGDTVAQAADAIVRASDRSDAIAALGERLTAARAGAEALDATIAQVDAQATKLAEGTTAQLVEALVRVRETGMQAAERARDALAAIVPDSRRAIETAVGEAIEAQVVRVSAAGERAAAQSRDAADRIERDLARVADAGAAAEARIVEVRASLDAADRDTLSQRSAELVEVLNSTAIDVARLLAADPGDTAWAAYLKGDRGAFTRRAVRLLDAGEAKTVAARYGEDEAFRAQVNRYVHDFEALLRPILALREGSVLAVVLLSSEMGKLYVALAQAIERLRA
ncbi:hypothetical protein [Sphingomonas sp.]|uniref:hypothetical protein n=1 Tax=Sphingomonas sp. TaxID=28214 RepID=UPI003B006BDC